LSWISIIHTNRHLPISLPKNPRGFPIISTIFKLKHYGLITKKLIDAAIDMEGDEQRILIEQIANQMKKLYLPGTAIL
jgi:hypothetical protein